MKNFIINAAFVFAAIFVTILAIDYATPETARQIHLTPDMIRH